MKRVPIAEYCEKKIPTLSPQNKSLIDYVDISSVDNLEKKIINIQQLTTEEAPSRAKQLLQIGDILVSTVRPNLNAVAMVEQNSKNTLVGSTGYCVLRCKNNINNRYVFHFCQSPYFVDDMVKQATGASYPAVNSNIVKNSLIPEYTKEKQNEIALTLDKTNNLICERKQQLSKFDELVKARFVELFGDYDLSHTQDNWKPIFEIGKVVGGATPKTNIDEFWDGEFRWITPAELQADTGYIYDSARKLTKAGVESCSLQEMPIDTVILSSRAPIGKVAIAGNTFYCNQGFKNIICNKEVLPRYLYTVLLLNTDYLNSLGRGATFKEISKSIVENIKIPVPKLELQNEFVNFVKQIDKSKFEVQQSLEKLETLKKSLMQQYFG